jgi:protein phosphatase
VLTRALGTRRAKPDLSSYLLDPDDQVLLCTDGLTTMLKDSQIAEIWKAKKESSRSACQALVAEANARGGQDNITVIIISRHTDARPRE